MEIYKRKIIELELENAEVKNKMKKLEEKVEEVKGFWKEEMKELKEEVLQLKRKIKSIEFEKLEKEEEKDESEKEEEINGSKDRGKIKSVIGKVEKYSTSFDLREKLNAEFGRKVREEIEVWQWKKNH